MFNFSISELQQTLSDPSNSTLAFAVVGFIVAVGVWLLVRAKSRTDEASSQQSDSGSGYTSQRGNMRANDWFNTALNIVMGTLLGIVVAGLGQKLATNFWLTVILTLILVAGFLGFNGLIDGLIDKIFPSGIRSARKPQARRRTPLLRLLSLPIGIVLGVALALLGLGDSLLDMI